MKRTVLLSLLVASVALSGCTVGDGPVSAKSYERAAERHAEGLVDAEVELMRITGAEDAQHTHDEEDGVDVRNYDDDNTGDGRAVLWAYNYRHGTDLVAVFVEAGKGIVRDVVIEGYYDIDEDNPFSELFPTEPITGSWMDSDTAAKKLGKHDDWPDMDDDSPVDWRLDSVDGCAQWTITHYEILDEETRGRTIALADSCTDDILSVEFKESFGFSFSCSGGSGGSSRDWDTVSGTISTLDLPLFAEGPGAVRTLDHENGTVFLAIQNSGGTGTATVTYTLTDPNGEVLVSGSGDVELEFEDQPMGDYTVTFGGEGVGTASLFYTLGTYGCTTSS